MSVFANSMEISSKSMGGKSICEFPDVCFTPPQTPATPPGLPLPYPNTGMASDTSDGSTSVKIEGEQIMLKDRSAFKKSTGDEAGAAPKKGMISSKNTGKIFFIAWSMDVKVEGENVVRNLDMTTHNHGSPANGAAPMVHTASAAMGDIPVDACKKDKDKIETKCGEGVDPCPGSLKKNVTEQRSDFTKTSDGVSRTAQAGGRAKKEAEADECVKAMRCFLRPYEPTIKKGGCCPGQSPHHVPPKGMMKDVADYSQGTALCVCLEGASQHVGSHGEAHAALDHIASKPGVLNNGKCTVAQYNKVCADATEAQCECESACIEAQLNGSMTDAQKKTEVTHWESNSKQLSDGTKGRIDDAYKTAGQVAE